MIKSLLRLLLLFVSFPVLGQDFQFGWNTDVFNNSFHSNSAAWADFDKDGDLDVFIANGESNQPNEFYINDNGDQLINGSNLLTSKSVPSFGGAWGDYNNDGWLDLYVANCNYQTESGAKNFLFKNKGDGTFEKITGIGPTEDSQTSYSASWIDYDNDGWLDLYVVNAYGQNNRLYRNAGNEVFQPIIDSPVSNLGGHNISAVWSDYDNDGDADLLVINTDWNRANEMYINNGSGGFSVANNLITNTDLTWSRSASWGDFNNDGWMDLILVDNEDRDILLQNDQAGDFIKVGDPAFEVAPTFGGNSSQWADFDNDGYLDLLLMHHFDVNPEFHHNNGDGTFTKQNNGWTDNQIGFAWSCSAIDMNLDGHLDIFQTNRYTLNEDSRPESNMLYVNEPNQCNYSTMIDLRGIQSNYFGIGARVRLFGEDEEGNQLMQKREMTSLAGGGYSIQTGTTLHFGTATIEKIDSIVVYWPSGNQTTYEDLPVNHHFELFEDGRNNILNDFNLKIVTATTDGCNGRIDFLNTKNAIGEITWRKDGILQQQGGNFLVSFEPGIFTYSAEDDCEVATEIVIDNSFEYYRFFPNPAHDQVTFEFNGSATANDVEIRIFDSIGKLVDGHKFDLSAGKNNFQIQVNNLLSGMYSVEIQSACWEIVEQLIVVSRD